MSKKRKFNKFLTGALVGVGLGMLFAPKKGSETRKELKKLISDYTKAVKEIDVVEVRENIDAKIFEIKMELEDLDKEKAIKFAKKRVNNIKDMVDELIEYTVTKGTPVLEDMANAIKEKSIQVTKEVLAKLEKNNDDNKKA